MARNGDHGRSWRRQGQNLKKFSKIFPPVSIFFFARLEGPDESIDKRWIRPSEWHSSARSQR
jgi:hypothetical protein